MQPGFPNSAPPLQMPARVQLEQARSPTVTYVIMGLTVFVYLLQMLGQQFLGNDYAALIGLKSNLAIYQGQFYRLFTPMLLHGSFLHLAFNMYALFVIGTRLERVMGHARFVALYIVAGFAGNVMSFLFQPSPSLGASTAIFGILAAEAVFIYMNRQYVVNARNMLTNIITLLGINLLLGLSGQIDNWGHLGGLIGGAIFAWFGGPKIGMREEVYPPVLSDTRTATDTILAAGLVLGIFGAAAVAAILFLPPPLA
jgi:rhomboid protease GluP